MSAAISRALRNRFDRRVVALLCLALFLALQLVAASASVHQALHPDANTPGHQCAFSLVTHGQIDAPAAWLGAAALIPVLVFLLPSLRTNFISSVDLRLAPSRAPPRS